jgi:hypothetical protein
MGRKNGASERVGALKTKAKTGGVATNRFEFKYTRQKHQVYPNYTCN